VAQRGLRLEPLAQKRCFDADKISLAGRQINYFSYQAASFTAVNVLRMSWRCADNYASSAAQEVRRSASSRITGILEVEMFKLRDARGGLDMLTAVLITIATAALIWRIVGAGQEQARARPPIEQVTGLRIDPGALANVEGRGRVALVEFADYECPFCSRHAQQTGRRIKKELVDSGGLLHVFFNFPLPIHRTAQKAAEAAECAGHQGRFWDMHQRLFADPNTLEVTDLTNRASQLGLDEAEFTKCLAGETAEKVRADVVIGQRLGVTSTPTFFVGLVQHDGAINITNRINGALPFDDFYKTIREVSAHVTAQR
jgi:protein-disulfide isomerase